MCVPISIDVSQTSLTLKSSNIKTCEYEQGLQTAWHVSTCCRTLQAPQVLPTHSARSFPGSPEIWVPRQGSRALQLRDSDSWSQRTHSRVTGKRKRKPGPGGSPTNSARREAQNVQVRKRRRDAQLQTPWPLILPSVLKTSYHMSLVRSGRKRFFPNSFMPV
jgi:hypothetical protein